jgi:hypothetical protein
MVEAVSTSETSVYSNETTRRYIPEGSNLHTLRRENLKFHRFFIFNYINTEFLSTEVQINGERVAILNCALSLYIIGILGIPVYSYTMMPGTNIIKTEMTRQPKVLCGN